MVTVTVSYQVNLFHFITHSHHAMLVSDSHKNWQRWWRCGPLHLCKSTSRSACGFRFRAAHAWPCSP